MVSMRSLVVLLAAGAAFGLRAGASSATCPSDRPGVFVAVHVGDSIVWGQGNLESTKFRNIVTEEYRRRRGVANVEVFNYSHSGAIIDDEFDDAPIADVPQPHGEIPSAVPTVEEQLDLAVTDLGDAGRAPADVDLLIVDGCINDTVIGTIIGTDASPAALAELSTEIDEQCRQDMGQLLERAAAIFTGADIVVTGYFPLFTEESDLGPLDDPAVLFVFGGTLGLVGWAVLEANLAAVADRSDVFARDSTAGLQAAVDAANAATPGPPRIRFHHPHFDADNAFAAPDALLFGWPPGDPVADDRHALCASVGQGGNLACNDAGSGHPTADGHERYVRAILSRNRGDGMATITHPVPGLLFSTMLEDTVAFAPPGEVVELMPGSYEPETPFRIERPLVLESFGGCAVIGR